MTNPKTVLVAPHSSNRECYHTVECDRTKDSYTEFTQDRAERSGSRPCQYCLGEIDYTNTPDLSYYEFALSHE